MVENPEQLKTLELRLSNWLFKGIMSGKGVLTLDRDIAALPGHPAFLKCERTGDRTVEITYDKDKSNAGEVLSLIQGMGLNIVDVTTREADLEDVFVSLTSSAAA